MPNVQEYAAKFTGDTRDFEAAADRVVQKSTGLTNTLGAGLVLGAGAAAGMAAFDALAGGIGAATSAGMNFEKTMSGVKAVSGASQAQLAQLSQLALKLGADTSFSASEAALGLEELVKAGVSVGDIMGGAAKASLDLAAAGGTDVASAAEIAANAMNAFALKGSDMAHVADLIAGAANASAIDVNDFKFSLASAGAVASTIGFSFDDLAQGIAVMGQAGIKGSDAGTSLKTMMMNLNPVTDKQTKLFRELGIVTADGANQFFDATGSVKSMAQVAQVLQTALGGMTKQQQLATLEVMFGSDAIRAGAVLTKAGAAGFNEMADAMGNVSAESVANTRLDNLAGSIEKFKGSAETAAITMGTGFTPALKAMVDAATANVNASLPGLQVFAEQMGGLATKYTPGIIRLGTAVQMGIGASVQFLGTQVLPRALDAAEGLFGFIEGTAVPAAASLLEQLGPRAVGVFTWLTTSGFTAVTTTAGMFAQTLTGTVVPSIVTLVDWVGTRASQAFGFLTGTAIPTALGMFGQLANFITGNVLVTLDALAQTVGPRLGAAFNFLTGQGFTGLLKVAGDVGTVFNVTVLPAFDMLAGWLQARIPAAFQFLTQSAVPAFLGAFQTVAAFVTGSLGPALGDLANWAGPKLGDAFLFLTKTIIPTVVTALTGIVGFIRGTAAPALLSFGEDVFPAIGREIDHFAQDVLPQIVSTGSTVVGWIRGTAIPALTNFGQWLGPLIRTSVDWLTGTAFPAIVSAGAAATDWIMGTAVPALTEFGSWLQPKIEAAWGWLTGTALPAIVSVGQTVADWVTGTAVPALQAFGEWLQPNLEAAWSWLTGTAFPAIVTAGDAVMTEFNEHLVPAFQTVVQWLDENVPPAIMWIANIGFPALWERGQILADTINEKVVTAWDTLTQKFSERGVFDSLNEIWTNLKDVGNLLAGAIGTINTNSEPTAGNFNAMGTAAEIAATGFKTFLWPIEQLVKAFKWILENGDAVKGILGVLTPGGAISSAIGAAKSVLPGKRTELGVEEQIALASRERGYDPATILAFAKHETGNFDSGLYQNANNIFSIKGEGPAGSTTMPAWEVRNGQNVMSPETFRKYDSPEQSINDFFDMIESMPRYAAAVAQKNDPEAFMRSLQSGGYATDPNWATNVLRGRSSVQVPDVDAILAQLNSQFAGANAMGIKAPATLDQMNLQGQGLSYSEAAAFCGPYAAELMMNALGRPITAQEAKQAAAAVGWTPGLGMRGVGSEEQLIDNLLQSQGLTGLDAYQMAGTTANARAGLAAGPIAISTPGHYFYGSDINEQGAINVGSTGTTVGGKEWMTLAEMEKLQGPIQGIIALQGQMGAGFTQLASTVDTAAGLMAGSLTGVTTAAGDGATAMQIFGQGMTPVAVQIAAGSADFNTLATSIVTAASSSGLAAQPFADLNMGLIDQETALRQVIAAAAAVDPQYAALSQAVNEGSISAQDAAVQFANMTSQTVLLASAVTPATAALQTMGGYAPTLIAEFGSGAISAETLGERIVGMASAAGLATGTLGETTAGTGEFNAQLLAVIQSAAEADPQFAALSEKIAAEGTITADTVLQFLDLLSRYQAVPAAAGTAQAATENLTTATDTLATTTSDTAGVVTTKQNEIAAGAKTMEGTVTGATTTMANTTAANATTMTDKMLAAIQKINADMNTNMEKLIEVVDSGSKKIISLLQAISGVEIDVDTDSTVKSLNKATTAAQKLKSALDKLDSGTSKNAKDAFSKGTSQGNTNVNPDFQAAGGWVTYAAAGMGNLNPVVTGELGRELEWLPQGTRITPHWKTALIEDNLAYGGGRSGGGDTITLIINGDVYDGDQFRERTIRALRDYRRQGGNV